MTCDAYLPADHAVLSNACASGDPCLRHHHGVGSYFRIVTHLDQVVQLHAFSNDRAAQCCAIDRAVGAYLHIVFNDHIADLRDLFLFPSPVDGEAKTIGADHRAAM